MALTKVVTQDKIEVVGEFKTVQVRTKTAILEDGVELSSGFHRHVVSAGDDYSAESAEVQAICVAVHTDAVVAAYAAHVAASTPQMWSSPVQLYPVFMPLPINGQAQVIEPQVSTRQNVERYSVVNVTGIDAYRQRPISQNVWVA